MRIVQILHKYMDSTARWIDGSRSGGAIWTKPHVIITHYYINIYTMSDNQEGEEAHIGDISDDSITTGQEQRTRLYDRFPFFEENYREEAAAEIANWTIKQGVEDYSDKSFGTFVWNVIERGEYDDLVEAQRFFEFLTSAWAKAAAPSLDQMISARKRLDGNVQAMEVDGERGAWKKYYLEKLKEQEDEFKRSLGRTKARLEREDEPCLV